MPAKITSSMPAPRIDLALVSPITQRKRFEQVRFAAAIGADDPVSPGSMRRSAGSTKLLKPVSRSRLICIAACPRVPGVSARRLP